MWWRASRRWPAGSLDRIVEVDLGANMAIDAALIAPNGTIASYSSTRVPEPVLPYYDLAFKGANLRLVQGFLLTEAMRAEAIARIAKMAAAGTLHHPAIHAFPLTDIAAAHEAAESGGLVGKVIVAID